MNSTKHNCWESSLLAAALAVVGTLFLFDKLGSLMQNNFSFDALVHTAPALIVVLGVSLLLADQSTPATRSQRVKESDHE